MDWSTDTKTSKTFKSVRTPPPKVEQKTDWMPLLLNTMNILGILFTIWAIYWGYKNHLFTSPEALRAFLGKMGVAAPLGFILIQIVQTIIPIIPGALTVPMGQMVFGAWYGFLLNFFAIMLGSMVNFFLARSYGQSFVKRIIGEKQFLKTSEKINKNNRFEKWFTFAMFFPFSPDDILCYMAGLTDLPFKKYFAILMFGKPLSIFLYSFGVAKLFEWFFIFIA